MAFQEILTPRLRIRRLSPADAAALARYRSRPEITRWHSWDTFSEARASELIATMALTEPGTAGEWFQFAVALLDSDRIIGDIGLLTRDREQGRTWIGYKLDPEYGGRGLMTEAVLAVVELTRVALGIEHVWASVDPRNARSIALLERAGFSVMEKKPGSVPFKGELADDWIYRL